MAQVNRRYRAIAKRYVTVNYLEAVFLARYYANSFVALFHRRLVKVLQDANKSNWYVLPR